MVKKKIDFIYIYASGSRKSHPWTIKVPLKFLLWSPDPKTMLFLEMILAKWNQWSKVIARALGPFLFSRNVWFDQLKHNLQHMAQMKISGPK